jgi:hypothetical protein
MQRRSIRGPNEERAQLPGDLMQFSCSSSSNCWWKVMDPHRFYVWLDLVQTGILITRKDRRYGSS